MTSYWFMLKSSQLTLVDQSAFLNNLELNYKSRIPSLLTFNLYATCMLLYQPPHIEQPQSSLYPLTKSLGGKEWIKNIPYGLLVQLSNGQGVNDWSPPIMASRRQIPAAEVMDYGPVTLSGSVPRRYQVNKHKIIDASTWLPKNY